MKIKKIISLMMICLSFCCFIPDKVLATKQTLVQGATQQITGGSDADDVDDVIDQMGDVNKVGGKGAEGRIANILNAVIRLIQIAGTGISVLIVTIVGIKYMWASPSEKADLKKNAVPIIIGCVLLFAATNLVAIVASVGNTLNGS